MMRPRLQAVLVLLALASACRATAGQQAPDEWAMLDHARAEQSQDQQRGPARGDPGTSDTDE